MDEGLEQMLQSKRSHEQPRTFVSRSTCSATELRCTREIFRGGELIDSTDNLESIPILSCVAEDLGVLLELGE